MTPFILGKYDESLKIFLCFGDTKHNVWSATYRLKFEIKMKLKQINIHEKLRDKSFSENLWLIYFDEMQRNVQDHVNI